MSQKDSISIGQLSKLSGLAVLRLRTWEDRYGIPKAMRLESGHRRYPAEELRRVQMIQQLIELGHKIGKIAHKDIAELEHLIDNELRVTASNSPLFQNHFADKHKWGDFIRNWDDHAFLSSLDREFEKFTPAEFSEYRLGPFLSYLGEQWSVGGMSVSQEHFASECIEYFITTKWRNRNARLGQRPIILAMTPGDYHTLGLQLCAMICVHLGQKIVYLGARVPIEEIARTALETNAKAVVLSISSLLEVRNSEKQLVDLRNQIPEHIKIVSGGKGSPKGIEGVLGCASFLALEHWVEQIVQEN